MTSLDTLFLISGATLLAALLLGRLRVAGPLLVALYAAPFWALIERCRTQRCSWPRWTSRCERICAYTAS